MRLTVINSSAMINLTSDLDRTTPQRFRCPWCEARRGFSYEPEKGDSGVYHCFACGAGGNGVHLYAALRNTDLAGALDAFGIDRDDSAPRRTPNPRSEQNANPQPTPLPPGTKEPSTLDTPERELREALTGYVAALKEDERARAYVEGRGLSVDVLTAYGCGYAAPGKWIGPGAGHRIVTPHTRPAESRHGRCQLVNLSGRHAGDTESGNRHRHIGGNPTALFNANAIHEGTGPLVVTEGPMDALSFIKAGHTRTVALHNTDGVPWKALQGATTTLVFAFDADDTGRTKARIRARDGAMRGFETHILPEGAYGRYSDPNEALQHGALSVRYLRGLTCALEPARIRWAHPPYEGDLYAWMPGADTTDVPVGLDRFEP